MIGENGLLDHPMSDMMSAGGLRYLPGPRSGSGGGARVLRHPPAKGSHPCRDGIFSERCRRSPRRAAARMQRQGLFNLCSDRSLATVRVIVPTSKTVPPAGACRAISFRASEERES